MDNSTSGSTLIIERTFDAPRQLVWDVWTKPEHCMKWWGARVVTCPVAKIDFRVGGKYHLCMNCPMPDGSVVEVWSTGYYKEINPIEKIVCTDSFADAEGNIVSGEHYGVEDFPMEVEVVIQFDDLGGKTRMILHHHSLPDSMKSDCEVGWNESFDKMSELLDSLK